jgi:hypothetical protein
MKMKGTYPPPPPPTSIKADYKALLRELAIVTILDEEEVEKKLNRDKAIDMILDEEKIIKENESYM